MNDWMLPSDPKARAVIEALPTGDRVLWLIGFIAQTSVGLEQNTRHLWHTLRGVAPEDRPSPPSVKDMIGKCSELLPDAVPPFDAFCCTCLARRCRPGVRRSQSSGARHS